MKDKILSIISFITVFIPITIIFVWKFNVLSTTSIVICYSIFIAISFFFALFLFVIKNLENTYTKVSLGLNGFYLAVILATVVIPRFI
jgi:hypothetical protein